LNLKTFLQKHLDDVLTISGAGLVIGATAALSVVAAVYVAGAFLILAGVLIGIGNARAAKQAAEVKNDHQ
jgi:Flp pilus assembly protein protease CpaA